MISPYQVFRARRRGRVLRRLRRRMDYLNRLVQDAVIIDPIDFERNLVGLDADLKNYVFPDGDFNRPIGWVPRTALELAETERAYVRGRVPLLIIPVSDLMIAPGRAARQLVALAVLILPAGQRARYAEEFRAELSDIRSARVRYALRLVAYSWSLRRGLLRR